MATHGRRAQHHDSQMLTPTHNGSSQAYESSSQNYPYASPRPPTLDARHQQPYQPQGKSIVDSLVALPQWSVIKAANGAEEKRAFKQTVYGATSPEFRSPAAHKQQNFGGGDPIIQGTPQISRVTHGDSGSVVDGSGAGAASQAGSYRGGGGGTSVSSHASVYIPPSKDTRPLGGKMTGQPRLHHRDEAVETRAEIYERKRAEHAERQLLMSMAEDAMSDTYTRDGGGDDGAPSHQMYKATVSAMATHSTGSNYVDARRDHGEARTRRVRYVGDDDGGGDGDGDGDGGRENGGGMDVRSPASPDSVRRTAPKSGKVPLRIHRVRHILDETGGEVSQLHTARDYDHRRGGHDGNDRDTDGDYNMDTARSYDSGATSLSHRDQVWYERRQVHEAKVTAKKKPTGRRHIEQRGLIGGSLSLLDGCPLSVTDKSTLRGFTDNRRPTDHSPYRSRDSPTTMPLKIGQAPHMRDAENERMPQEGWRDRNGWEGNRKGKHGQDVNMQRAAEISSFRQEAQPHGQPVNHGQPDKFGHYRQTLSNRDAHGFKMLSHVPYPDDAPVGGHHQPPNDNNDHYSAGGHQEGEATGGITSPDRGAVAMLQFNNYRNGAVQRTTQKASNSKKLYHLLGAKRTTDDQGQRDRERQLLAASPHRVISPFGLHDGSDQGSDYDSDRDKPVRTNFLRGAGQRSIVQFSTNKTPKDEEMTAGNWADKDTIMAARKGDDGDGSVPTVVSVTPKHVVDDRLRSDLPSYVSRDDVERSRLWRRRQDEQSGYIVPRDASVTSNGVGAGAGAGAGVGGSQWGGDSVVAGSVRIDLLAPDWMRTQHSPMRNVFVDSRTSQERNVGHKQRLHLAAPFGDMPGHDPRAYN